MLRTVRCGVLVPVVLAVTSLVSAQRLADGPVVYGHHHLNVSNVDATRKFLVEALGGTEVNIARDSVEAIHFPNVLIFMRAQAPTGGTKGSSVDHIAFSVPDLRRAVDRIKASGFRMVTRAEVATNREVHDDIALPVATEGRTLDGQWRGRVNTTIAYAMGPDDVKVELIENRQQTLPIVFGHVHFFGQQSSEMRTWYSKVFGAKPRDAPNIPFLVADLPGAALHFSPSTTPLVGTTGRALDHIGFEVRNLEEFCRKLEAAGIRFNAAHRQLPANVSMAFITDPWGTDIELTEGLDKLF